MFLGNVKDCNSKLMVTNKIQNSLLYPKFSISTFFVQTNRMVTSGYKQMRNDSKDGGISTGRLITVSDFTEIRKNASHRRKSYRINYTVKRKMKYRKINTQYFYFSNLIIL